MLSIIAGLARLRDLRVAVLCGFAASLAVACDKVPLLAPQESTITLSSASTVVQANGTTQIHAIVIEPSGTPVHDGTTVLFTTNLGTLVPVEGRTQNGVATVQFLGNGQSGKATIKALSGGSASDALELSVGAGASGRVSVTANPALVPAAGGTTTISAAVVDASGNPLFGVPVSFGTTAGTFSAAVVNSDTSGTARTTLTTNQAASVTATAGGTTSAPVAITVAAVPARPTVSPITVSGTPTEGGVTTFSLTVTPPATGGSPIQAVTVDYGDQSSDDLGSVSGTISVQHVYEDSGSFRPTVTVVDSSGTSVTASTVIFVQPLLVSIDARKGPAAATTIPVTLTANVSPAGSSIASYTWTFDDGTPPQTTGTAETVHDFPIAPAKTYNVRVIARTSTRHASTGTTSVRIP
jgi:Bacterial Ig-like domain (group 1)/PKD domain